MKFKPSGDSTHRPSHADGRVLRLTFGASVGVALLTWLAAALTQNRPSLTVVLTADVLPAVIVGLMALGRLRPWARLGAAVALNVEAVLAGTVLPGGLAFAVILPIIAVGLVQPSLGRRFLLGAFLVAGAAAIAGVSLAVLIGPARDAFNGSPAVTTILSFAALALFALALTWRSIIRRVEALATAEGEIAARDAAEAELSRASELLSAIVESSPVPTMAFAPDRTVSLWNPAAARLFGWSTAETLGRPFPPEMVPEDDRERSGERIQRTLAGQVIAGDRVRRLAKDGREMWVDIHAGPLRDRAGKTIGMAGQMVDMTERVKLEWELIQAQKMEAIGLMASGIAHDFNNTLTAAGGFAALIRDRATDPTIEEDAATIVGVIERGRQMTRQLLSFAGATILEPRTIDLRSMLTDIEPVIQRAIGSGVNIVVRVAPEPVIAKVDPGQLEQALINLALNGRDAMPDGGELTFVVANAAPVMESAATMPAVFARAFVTIAVSDTGTGIPAEHQARVFEPFFTTKKPGHGTGLGLATVRGFVEQSGGRITVHSEPGRGTTFVIALPAVGDGIEG